MKKILKWTGIVLGSLVALLLIVYGYMYYRTDSRFNKAYEVSVQPITIPTDSASLVLGLHIANIKGCGDCHGPDLGGKVVVDDPGLGYLPAPNLTTGKGGLLSRHKTYTDEDYIRAIKHGIGKDNKTLKLMPAYEYNPLSQKDLGALVAYLKSVKPVDREMAPIALKPVAYVLTHLNKLPLVAAEKVDHSAQSREVVQPEVTVAYGKYVAVSCTGCHRDNFRGGDGLIPGSPAIPDITAAGNVGKWTEEQFINTMRTGVRPDGRKMNPQFMPWPMAKEYTDTEIKSLYLYLNSLQS
jgi:mono/diheme cytochrome c family protein